MKNIGPYEIGKQVGKGATGTVYLGVDSSTRKQVAVKVMKNSENSKRALKHEVYVMTRLAHENITAIRTVLEDDKNTYIILEYVGKGELYDTVVKWKKNQRERFTFHYFNQLMNGLKYLHDSGYCHRDLKLENLLLSKDGVLKIADFGVSKDLNANPMHTCCGSPDYIAPEVITDKQGYDGRLADLWSCGVILYAMLCGEFPFEDTPHILRGQYKAPKWIPKLAKDSVIDRILVVNPSDRLQSVDAVMDTEWFLSFKTQRNTFGMFYEMKRKRRSTPFQVFRFVSLRVIICIKVCRALSSASIKGEPRDIREVVRDRLITVCCLLRDVIDKVRPDDGFQDINWAAFRNSASYERHLNLLGEIQRSDLKRLSDREKLAVFLNLYHLILIHSYASGGHHISKMSDKERQVFFHNSCFVVGYTVFSLDDIFHGIFRANARGGGWFSKQQIDEKLDPDKSALVLKSLNPLCHLCVSHLTHGTAKMHIYSVENIEEQMKDCAMELLDRQVEIDLPSKTLLLPHCFMEFKTDFGKTSADSLQFIKQYLRGQKLADFVEVCSRGTPNFKFLPKNYGFLWAQPPELEHWERKRSERHNWTAERRMEWRKLHPDPFQLDKISVRPSHNQRRMKSDHLLDSALSQGWSLQALNETLKGALSIVDSVTSEEKPTPSTLETQRSPPLLSLHPEWGPGEVAEVEDGRDEQLPADQRETDEKSLKKKKKKKKKGDETSETKEGATKTKQKKGVAKKSKKNEEAAEGSERQEIVHQEPEKKEDVNKKKEVMNKSSGHTEEVLDKSEEEEKQQKDKPTKKKDLKVETEILSPEEADRKRKKDALHRKFPSTRADVGSPRTYQHLDLALQQALDAVSDELLSNEEAEPDWMEEEQMPGESSHDAPGHKVEEPAAAREGQEEEKQEKKPVVKKKKKKGLVGSEADADLLPKAKKKAKAKVSGELGQAVIPPPSSADNETPKAKVKKVKKKQVAPVDAPSDVPVPVHTQGGETKGDAEGPEGNQESSASREAPETSGADRQHSAWEEDGEKEISGREEGRSQSFEEMSATLGQDPGSISEKRRSLLSGLHVGATKKLQEKAQPLILVRYSEKKARQQGRFCCIT